MVCTYSTCHKIISLPDSDHLVKSGDQLREDGRDGGRKESDSQIMGIDLGVYHSACVPFVFIYLSELLM